MTAIHPKVAFLGTGLLGFPMAERLLENRVPLTVWNRTRTKAEPLAERGAAVADSPREALRGADIVILMLTDFPAIRKVLLGPEVLPLVQGRVVVQMGTIAPAESLATAEAVEEAGGRYLEAPVLGSIPQARAAELMVLAGGDAAHLEEVRPVLACFGPLRHIGGVGDAAALKLALNQLEVRTGFFVEAKRLLTQVHQVVAGWDGRHRVVVGEQLLVFTEAGWELLLVVGGPHNQRAVYDLVVAFGVHDGG